MKFAPLDAFSRLRMVSLVTRSVPVLGRHSPFFGLPIFSALRNASRAPIPPAASRHNTALSIQRVLNPPGGAASP